MNTEAFMSSLDFLFLVVTVASTAVSSGYYLAVRIRQVRLEQQRLDFYRKFHSSEISGIPQAPEAGIKYNGTGIIEFLDGE